MTEDAISLSAVARLLGRRWRLLVLAASVGAGLGGLVALAYSPSYYSGSKVLIQDEPDEARVISEAQIATSLAVLDRVAEILHWGKDGAALVRSVSATAMDGDILRIDVRAGSPSRARHLADLTTEQYLTYSTGLLTKTASASESVLLPQREVLRQQLDGIDARTAELRGQPDLRDSTSVAGAAAHAELQDLEGTRVRVLQQVAALEGQIAQAHALAVAGAQHFAVLDRPVEPAAASSLSRLGLTVRIALGALILTAVVLVLRRQRDRRLYEAADIARAAGVALLGVVSVQAATRSPGPGGRGEQESKLRELRYRRFLAKLTTLSSDAAGEPRAPVAMLLVAGDALAERAAARVAELAGDDVPLLVLPIGMPRPTVPDLSSTARVVLSVTVGTLTAGQLMDLAGACHDAGRLACGALVVMPEGSGRLLGRIRPAASSLIPAASP